MDERAPSVAVDRTPTRRERYWFVSAGCTRGARAPPPARWMTDPLRHRRPRARDMLGTAEHAAGIANAFAHRRDLASHDASAAADRRDPLGGRAGPLARHDPGPRASRERTRAGRGVADDDRVRRLARPARRRNVRARLDDRGDAGQPEERFRSPRRVDQDQHAADTCLSLCGIHRGACRRRSPSSASSGEWNAKIAGTMKIYGTERPLVWDLKITRSAAQTRASGTTAFRFGDYGMVVPANRLVLSVVDDLRLEIDVVARDD